MKILIFSNSCEGTYMFRRELINDLLQSHSVVLSVPTGLHFDEFEKTGCKMIAVKMERRGKNPIKEISLYKKYYEIISKEKPDVVLTFTAKPNLYVPGICKRKNIECISNVGGLGRPYETGFIKRKAFIHFYKNSLKKSNVVFFQNSENMSVFLNAGLDKAKCELLAGSGVNTERFAFEDYPDEKSDMVFLFAGRIEKDKGIDEFLFCAKKIKEKYPLVKFEIAGSIESKEYEEKIADAQKNGYVTFLGFVDDMPKLYKRVHAAVVPSYHEGLSNICLEASATGRPVIASKIHGCEETFEQLKTGIGFQAKNPKALYEAVEKFILLPYGRKVEMGKAARNKIEREFDRKIIVNKYKKSIKNVKH